MGSRRAQIVIPDDLVHEIDSLVGPRKRVEFLVESARAELRRRSLLLFLQDGEFQWKDEDHPELAAGTAQWVQSLRAEGERNERSSGGTIR